MNCLFCKIVAGHIPSSLVYEDGFVFAFRDIKPEAPVHIVIVPKKHIESLDKLEESDSDLMGKIVFAASKIAQQENIAENGYRLVANCGTNAGQSVWHIHFHLLGGREFSWPAG